MFCFKNWKAPACTKGERQMVEKYIFLKNSFLADKHSGDLQKSLLSKYEGNRLQVFAWRFAFFEARGKNPHKSVDRIIEKESATGGTRKFRNPASWCLSMFHVWLLGIQTAKLSLLFPQGIGYAMFVEFIQALCLLQNSGQKS